MQPRISMITEGVRDLGRRVSRARSRTAIVACAALLAVSCAGLSERHHGARPVTYSLSCTFYTFHPESGELVSVPRRQSLSEVSLEFSLVQGTINGPPSGGALPSVAVAADFAFELTLPAPIEAARARFDSKLLLIEPADTRIARLATFHHYPEYGRFRGGGGFVDADSGDPLVLVYFSQPARVHGATRDPTGRYVYDVSVDAAGWSWLIMRRHGADTFLVSNYPGEVEDIELAVLLPHARARSF